MYELQNINCRILRQFSHKLQFAVFSYHVFLEDFSSFPYTHLIGDARDLRPRALKVGPENWDVGPISLIGHGIRDSET